MLNYDASKVQRWDLEYLPEAALSHGFIYVGNLELRTLFSRPGVSRRCQSRLDCKFVERPAQTIFAEFL